MVNLHFCSTCAVCSLLILCLAISARSQSTEVHVTSSAAAEHRTAPPVTGPESATRPLRVGVDVVLVPVTVTDSMNRPVTGLEKQDFTLLEDEQPQEIRYFWTEDAPISVGILLDLSRSMSNKIDDARAAVGEFFKTAHPEDDYFIITFADRPEVLADTTQSTGSIQAKLASATPAGHTALLDAIYLGIAKMRSARYNRRALLIISDGGDNRSRYSKPDIRRLVQEADVEIYAIGIFDSVFKTPEEWAGKRLLTEITEATGGRTLTLDNPRRLPELAATVSLELRNQYVLGFHRARATHDRRWRRIKVKMAASRGDLPLHLYSKKGYLGPEE
jgi:Ca-activated chloride channel family protein